MNTKNSSVLIILCTLLNTTPCHAWYLPVPTKRDISVAIMASVSTIALLRNHYFGQERRIKKALRLRNLETQNIVKAEAQETRNTVKATSLILLTAVDEANNDQQEQHRGLAAMLFKIHQDQQRIKHDIKNLSSLYISRNSQPLLLENKPQANLYHINLDSAETPLFRAALARVKLPRNAHLITTLKKIQSIPITTALRKNLFAGTIEYQESFFSKIKGTIGLY